MRHQPQVNKMCTLLFASSSKLQTTPRPEAPPASIKALSVSAQTNKQAYKDTRAFKMGFPSKLPIFFLLFSGLVFALTQAATFLVQNQCPYTVWAAASPGGGRRLEPGQSWTLNVAAGTAGARIWGRTNCNFDGSGRGWCQTGDCGGLLQCQGYGSPPNTLAEFALNQFMNLDFFDISLVDGFNIPMDFSPTSGGCRGIKCTADIIGQCPAQLRAPGGCNNPCTVYKTDEYCCNSGSCGPTPLSRFFKERCPDAYSYPKDDPTSTFTCPGGTNYRVIFCPRGSSHLYAMNVTSDAIIESASE
ncbi:PREDICTED: protein P21-like [Nelumbo nucifera]|uniref:Protein P21-like n=2 Tax=Nelumbo nucifera TaxID=4432 RepID=A0A1U8BEZ7_NELNU|nr:PREDICTED: protein P21-like [Nelumbo nucifera]DAD18184.1 TPA_asm: hypothetical protein HUJ06_019647 [Nelumbo nucifera]